MGLVQVGEGHLFERIPGSEAKVLKLTSRSVLVYLDIIPSLESINPPRMIFSATL